VWFPHKFVTDLVGCLRADVSPGEDDGRLFYFAFHGETAMAFGRWTEKPEIPLDFVPGVEAYHWHRRGVWSRKES